MEKKLLKKYNILQMFILDFHNSENIDLFIAMYLYALYVTYTHCHCIQLVQYVIRVLYISLYIIVYNSIYNCTYCMYIFLYILIL